jgi:glutamine amidotransferase
MGAGRVVAIVDYGLCNLDSVGRAVQECGGEPRVTAEPSELERADRIILPGVGAFAEAMSNLRRAGLDKAMREQVSERGIPMLGLCLGMQLLGRRGDEGGETAGLGLLDAEVARLVPDAPGVRIPHMGWNEVRPERPHRLLDGIPAGRDFYFVHSYHLVCRDQTDVVARTPYCGGFASVVARENVHACQFHPEKSQKAGFRLLRNFLAL